MLFVAGDRTCGRSTYDGEEIGRGVDGRVCEYPFVRSGATAAGLSSDLRSLCVVGAVAGRAGTHIGDTAKQVRGAGFSVGRPSRSGVVHECRRPHAPRTNWKQETAI